VVPGTPTRCCAGCCDDNAWMSKPWQRARWILALILLLFGLAVFAIGVKQSFTLTEHGDALWRSAQQLDSYKSTVITNANTLRTVIDSTILDVDKVKSQAQLQPDIVAAADGVKKQLSDAQSQFNTFMTAIPNSTLDNYITEAQDQQKYVNWSHIGLFLIFLVSVLLLLGVTCQGQIATRSCCYCGAQIWTLFFLVVTWLLVCAYFFVAMSLADTCQTPGALIEGISIRELGVGSQQDLVSYYVHCNATSHPSPLQTQSDNAHVALANATVAVAEIRARAAARNATILLPAIDFLNADIQNANLSLTNLFASLQCNRVTPIFATAVLAVCSGDSILNDLATLVAFIGASQAVLCLARLLLPSCLCCRKAVRSGHELYVAPGSQSVEGLHYVQLGSAAGSPAAPHAQPTAAGGMVGAHW